MVLTTLPEDFWSKVDRLAGDDKCWPWRGGVSGKGYGYYLGKRAHRLAYEALVGPIPTGLVLDHVCRDRLCVNPAHLEPVTNRENVLRGEHPNAVTHRTGLCQRGHSMEDAKNGECRKCIRIRDAGYRAAKRQAVPS